MNKQLLAGSVAFSERVGKECVVTIGNFDGVHLGHQELLKKTIEEAKKRNILSCVFTFEPAPRTMLASHLQTPRIMSWQEKVEKLLSFGVDCVIIEEFSVAFAAHPPEWFATEIIQKRLQAQAVVVGHDFRYGKARAGTVDSLRKTLSDVSVFQIMAFQKEQETISSSRIRKLVTDGKVNEAKELLGEPYIIKGTVVGGNQRGRLIGFPTANIETSADLLPKTGVYAVEVQLNRGMWRKAMLNIGLQPTFDGGKFQIEAHIFDFSNDVYGEEIRIRFHHRTRSEKRFSSKEDLKKQLEKDQNIIQNIFN